MPNPDHLLALALEKRKQANALRALSCKNGLVDFCSNDYLGFACSHELQDEIKHAHRPATTHYYGSTGSRLLTGNHALTEEVEQQVATFHRAEAGLIFNSGYDANVGLFSAVPQRNEVILYDELCHASIRDGVRLSLARSFSFKHNDVEGLERKLANIIRDTTTAIYVAVESVYSMDGDFAPLREIAALCSQYGAFLVVDEAHATGVFGNRGEGRVVEMDLEKECFARVHTFGKALGCHGAIVLGSCTLREYLVNFSRPFIYTTALPIHSILSVQAVYRFLQKEFQRKKQVLHLARLLQSKLKVLAKGTYLQSDSQVQCVIFPGNEEVKRISYQLEQAGFDVRPILSPTVPRDKERLRICVHSFNTEAQIEQLTALIERA